MGSGRFITQQPGTASEYRAFIPSPLPPSPALNISAIWRDLSTADTALARLDGVATTLPHPELFVWMYVRHEATLSSQIEGTQSTLEDVLAVESDEEELPEGSDVDEIFNYVSALDHGLKRLKELPLSLRLIREIHEKLLQGVRGEWKTPGRFRDSQNWIGGENIGTATFVPPPPVEMADALGSLEKFLHRPDQIPVLVHCALVHAQFETIHPFLDGNGRIGRLLITLQLCHEKTLQHPLLYLSYFFKVHRAEYYDRLQAIRLNGEWLGWVKFFLRGVREVSEAATRTARGIHELRERLRSDDSLTKTGRDLVHALFSRPIITANQAAATLECSYATANNTIAQLVSKQILMELTGHRRNRRFRFKPYLSLFDRQAVPVEDEDDRQGDDHS
ncbi:MAG: Fic family protein [Planctomycetota bacterium]|jgi:Fic family protein